MRGGSSTSGSGVGALGSSGMGIAGKGGTSILGVGSGEGENRGGATGSGNFLMTGMTKGLDFCREKATRLN